MSDPGLQLQLQEISKSFGGVQAVTRVSIFSGFDMDRDGLV